ncbi:MAG: hypothetical protein ACOX5R_15650 [bacterium]|jgi:hypothetical protein
MSQVLISLDNIFSLLPENAFIETLENHLENLLMQVCTHTKQDPHGLIHVVENDSVHLLSVADAQQYIQQSSQNQNRTIQQNVQHALQGNYVLLAREMKVLVSLANKTLNRYRDQKLIPDQEIMRIQPNLLRVGRQVCYLLGNLQELETRMSEIRRTHSILRDFEEKVALLQKLLKAGKQEDVCRIAKELASIKHKYLFASRGFTSDARQASRLRLDIQQQKKTILSIQRYLTAQRQGTLQEQMQGVKKAIEDLKSVIFRNGADRKERYQSILQDQALNYKNNLTEMQVVHQTQGILAQKEKETEAVIQTIQRNIGVIPDKVPVEMNQKPPLATKVFEQLPVTETNVHNRPLSNRMVSIERRQRER